MIDLRLETLIILIVYVCRTDSNALTSFKPIQLTLGLRFPTVYRTLEERPLYQGYRYKRYKEKRISAIKVQIPYHDMCTVLSLYFYFETDPNWNILCRVTS